MLDWHRIIHEDIAVFWRMAFTRDPRKLFPHDRLLGKTIVPLIPLWVTPNAITILRFFGTPFVLFFLSIEAFVVGIPLFIFFAFTDALDGSLARLRNQITAWGTFYDPIADKLLIGSVAILITARYIHPAITIILVLVECLIVIGGYYMRRKGHLMSANIFGKTKMFLQVVGVGLLLLGVALNASILISIAAAILMAAILFAVISLFTYGL